VAASGEGTPGTNFERDPLRGQQLCFFGAPAEQVGIATFEAHDRLAFARSPGELAVDLGLALANPSRTLAHEHELRVGPCHAQLIGMHECVVEHDIRLAKAPEPARGNQLWIARAGTHQVHFAGSGHLA
jgi:hypothetical protein